LIASSILPADINIMFNLDPHALAALICNCGEPCGTAETPTGNPQNLLGVFELLNALSGGQLGGESGAAVTGAGGAGNPAVTPQVEGGGQVAQAPQTLPNLTTPNQATTTGATLVPAPPSPAEQKGVTVAIERVIARSTAARIKNEFKWQWIGGSNESKKFKEEALTPGQGIKV
jgi:hypothetical protein